MIYSDTVTQAILVRFEDGVIRGAMVTEQDLFINGDDESLVGRSALKMRDMDKEALQDLANYLGADYIPPYFEPLVPKTSPDLFPIEAEPIDVTPVEVAPELVPIEANESIPAPLA